MKRSRSSVSSEDLYCSPSEDLRKPENESKPVDCSVEVEVKEQELREVT